MEILRKNFPEIMLDNDENYISHLIGVVEAVDEFACMEIIKTIHSYCFRIAPSEPKYMSLILQEVLKYNNLFGIHLDLGKSMKTSSSINFNIELNQ